MVAEHLQALLGDESCSELLRIAAQKVGPVEIPKSASAVLRMGRLTALRKPNGRVKGVVATEILRRLVAKSRA